MQTNWYERDLIFIFLSYGYAKSYCKCDNNIALNMLSEGENVGVWVWELNRESQQ